MSANSITVHFRQIPNWCGWSIQQSHLPFQIFGDEATFARCIAGTQTAGESHVIGAIVRFGDETQLTKISSDALP